MTSNIFLYEDNLNYKKPEKENNQLSSLIESSLIEKKIKNEFEEEYDPKIRIKSLDEFINLLEKDEKYEGIKKYALGSYHPKDFNYHDKYSCGPQNNLIDKNNKIEDALRKNNIFCEESDYEEYIDKKIDDSGLSKIKSSRRKACNCEYQRKLTLDHYKKNEPEKLVELKNSISIAIGAKFSYKKWSLSNFFEVSKFTSNTFV